MRVMRVMMIRILVGEDAAEVRGLSLVVSVRVVVKESSAGLANH